MTTPKVGVPMLADVGAVAENTARDMDPIALFSSLIAAGAGALRNPAGTVAATSQTAWGLASAVWSSAAVALGRQPSVTIEPKPGDKRFSEDAYRSNPLYFLLAQEYLLACELVDRLISVSGVDDATRLKAGFAAKFLLDALSPSNTFVGNPAAIRKAFDTGGKSVVRGLRNMAHDVRRNGGWPSQVDSSGFEVGVNMAATPGHVVYRSELIEIIQYTPQAPETYAIPLLFCPPWINKYYILDLAPGKSLIEWAVQHGHTCFAISYRNPVESMSTLGFRDYLFQGPLDAVRVVRDITGADAVNTLSVCLGGTLTAMGLAYNADAGDRSINSATFINTHTDFSEPGMLGVFTDESTIAGLERTMAKKGFLDSSQMARTFSSLRANDLIFNYVVNNWLLGNKPPRFDLLTWNADATRMPAKMHSEYLRSCYLKNEFARGEFKINGHRLNPGDVEVDSYVVSAIDDHIVPWTSAYKTTQLLGGENRFVLSTSGHIAGIVNPPSPKSKHWTNDDLRPDPLEWKAGTELRDASWWEDWTKWIGERSGAKVTAPESAGSDKYPILDPAPGRYVRAGQ
jgi:polyhydroxyalkanoate synthase